MYHSFHFFRSFNIHEKYKSYVVKDPFKRIPIRYGRCPVGREAESSNADVGNFYNQSPFLIYSIGKTKIEAKLMTHLKDNIAT